MTQGILAAALGVVLFIGCRGEEHGHDHEPHTQHAHDDARDSEAEELPGQSVTVWTEKTELFMEYRPLIAGQESAFAAHVTAIPGFKAVTQGSLTVGVVFGDGGRLTGNVDQPSSPGIFRPTVRPANPGECQLRVTVVRDSITDEISAGACRVFPDEEAARAALGEEAEEAGRITYLKEQQWKTVFATAAVAERELQDSVQVNGEIVPAAGKDARIATPAAGRVTLAASPPVLGMAVRKDNVLALFTPHLAGGDRATLEADVQSAHAEAEAAKAQLARAERLFAEQAIPRKNVEEAQARAATSRARLQAATGRLEQYDAGLAGRAEQSRGSIELRSPIDGTLVEVEITSGEAVEAGKLLFRIIDLSSVWLEARIFEPDIPKVEGARSGWFVGEGDVSQFAFSETNSRAVTLGNVIDPVSRTVPAIFEVQNPDRRLRVGQFVKVGVSTGKPIRTLAVPETALVDDAGKLTAYVQVEGEAFERRIITAGIRDAGWVQVIDGLAAGERVVTTGAYEIKLSAASGVIPAHGHAH